MDTTDEKEGRSDRLSVNQIMVPVFIRSHGRGFVTLFWGGILM